MQPPNPNPPEGLRTDHSRSPGRECNSDSHPEGGFGFRFRLQKKPVRCHGSQSKKVSRVTKRQSTKPPKVTVPDARGRGPCGRVEGVGSAGRGGRGERGALGDPPPPGREGGREGEWGGPRPRSHGGPAAAAASLAGPGGLDSPGGGGMGMGGSRRPGNPGLWGGEGFHAAMTSHNPQPPSARRLGNHTLQRVSAAAHGSLFRRCNCHVRAVSLQTQPFGHARDRFMGTQGKRPQTRQI